MRKLILTFLLLTVAGCGGAARPVAAGPAPFPTPDHKAWLQAVKPKAVALNTVAKDLLVAYDSRDIVGIQAKLKSVQDAADALQNAIFANSALLPGELSSAKSNALTAYVDGQLLANDWSRALDRADYQYLTDTEDRLRALIRDSDQAIKEMV